MAKSMFLVMMMALVGCVSSPPKPPSCDGFAKRPIHPSQQQKMAVNPASYLSCSA